MNKFVLTSMNKFELTSMNKFELTSMNKFELASMNKFELTSMNKFEMASMNKFDLTNINKFELASMNNVVNNVVYALNHDYIVLLQHCSIIIAVILVNKLKQVIQVNNRKHGLFYQYKCPTLFSFTSVLNNIVEAMQNNVIS